MMVDDSHPNGGEFFEWLDNAQISPEELAICFLSILHRVRFDGEPAAFRDEIAARIDEDIEWPVLERIVDQLKESKA